MMATSDEIRFFHDRYLNEDAPWDSGRPDKNLREIMHSIRQPVKNCLEIGCGTGDNAIFLAQRGIDVTATDIVEIALDRAREKAKKKGVSINFLLKDIMEQDIPGRPFDLVFDRGCFHHFRTDEARSRFVKRTYSHLTPEGMWISLIGNADEKTNAPGPPRLSALQIVTAVEPFFEILLLKSSRFDSKQTLPPRCWVFMGKKRKGAL